MVAGRSISRTLWHDRFLLNINRKTSEKPPPAISSTISSQSTSLSAPAPTASSNSTIPKPTLNLMSNTAVVALSCENGDRWIITQNMTGALRGLYSNMTNGHTSPWTTFSKDLNFTSTRPNTPISASCISISPNSESFNGFPSAGLYVSRDTCTLLRASIHPLGEC